MKVFISYSRADQVFVHRLATDLRVREGIDASFDQWEIYPGNLFIEVLEKSLEEANVLIIVLSPDSVKSRWVTYERDAWLTKQIEDEKLTQRVSLQSVRRLIPVLYRNCLKPLFLQPVHHISITDQTYEAGLEQLAQAIRGESVKPPLREQNSTLTRAVLVPSVPFTSSFSGIPPRLQVMMLLKRLMPSQFEEVVFFYGIDPAHLPTHVAQVEKAITVIQYAVQQEGEALVKLLNTIYAIKSPFSPFNGNTLENWVGYPQDCWQVANRNIIGVGDDPLTFSDPDTPLDLRYASLLMWEGLRFRDGDIAVSAWVPLVERGGTAGLVLRSVKDQSALIGLIRQVQTTNSLALELWHRESTCLRLLQSVPCLPHILIEGSCHFEFGVHQNRASISVTSALHPEGASSCNASVPLDQSPGHVGFIKFGGAAVTFASLELSVCMPENGLL